MKKKKVLLAKENHEQVNKFQEGNRNGKKKKNKKQKTKKGPGI